MIIKTQADCLKSADFTAHHIYQHKQFTDSKKNNLFEQVNLSVDFKIES